MHPLVLLWSLRVSHHELAEAAATQPSQFDDEIHQAFQKSHAFAEPPTFYCVCTSKLKKGGSKYSVHQGDHCSGGGWDAVDGGVWRAYAKEKPGMKAITWCDNEKHWTQIMVKGASCPESWSGLKWVHGGTFYVKEGSSFCTGTRKTEAEETSFSKLVAKKNCGGDGFSHDMGFDPAPSPDPVASVGICVGQDSSSQKAKISMLDECDDGGFSHVARFAARRAVYASKSDRIFCVVPSSDGDIIRAGSRCSGNEGFDFALPVEREHKVARVAPELGKSLRLCVGFRKGKDRAFVGVDQQCETLQSISVDFKVPSLLDIAASTPSSSTGSTSETAPLFTIVEEQVLCFGFLCPHVLSSLK